DRQASGMDAPGSRSDAVARANRMTVIRRRRRIPDGCMLLASPAPRRASYGHGCPDLLHGRDGPRAPRGRQPLRGGARGAARDPGAPALAPTAQRPLVRDTRRVLAIGAGGGGP